LCDWSSDVCSSDLLAVANRTVERAERLVQLLTEPGGPGAATGLAR